MKSDFYANPRVSKKALQTFFDKFQPEKNEIHTLFVSSTVRTAVFSPLLQKMTPCGFTWKPGANWMQMLFL